MKVRIIIHVTVLVFTLFLFTTCEPKVTRSYLLNSPIYDQELLLKWEKKGHLVNWSIYQSTATSCYKLLIETRLKLYQNGVVIQQQDEWKPYVFFDATRLAIFSQMIDNERYILKSKLFKKAENNHTIRQVVERPDGEETILYLHYDRNWMLTKIQIFHHHQLMTFYTLDTAILLENWKACKKLRKQ